MPQRGAPDSWDSPASRPSTVKVIVESGPGRRAGVRRALSWVAVAAAIAVVAGVVLAGMPGTKRRATAPADRLPVAVVADYANAPPGMVPVYADSPASVAEPYLLPRGCAGSPHALLLRGYRRPRLLDGYRPVTRRGVQVASCALRNIP